MTPRVWHARATTSTIASVAKQSRIFRGESPDGFAEPVIGPRFARTRWLAMTECGTLRPRRPPYAQPRRHACHPRRLLADQAEAEIRGRDALCTATGSGVADEIGNVSAMGTLGDAHATIYGLAARIAGLVDPVAHEAGRGPFPDIAGQIGDAVLVDAELVERIGGGVGEIAVGFALVAADPASCRIVRIDGQSVVPESASRGERPFLVARQAVVHAGSALH